MNKKPKVDDVVFCKVKKIEGTTVFLEIEEYGVDGSMVLSEVAAGRIRNLKKYVSPNRIVVCKVLKVLPNHVELSLRRVTAKEKEEVFERRKKERALANVLEAVGENPDKIIPKIKEEHDIFDFFDEAGDKPALLEKYISKVNAEKISKLLSEKEVKEKRVSKKFILSSLSEQGVKDIREILSFNNVEIHYIGSSRFSILANGKDFREANNKMNEFLVEIEKRAKQKKAFFEVLKEK